jgi:hypothetical protein
LASGFYVSDIFAVEPIGRTIFGHCQCGNRALSVPPSPPAIRISRMSVSGHGDIFRPHGRSSESGVSVGRSGECQQQMLSCPRSGECRLEKSLELPRRCTCIIAVCQSSRTLRKRFFMQTSLWACVMPRLRITREHAFRLHSILK